MIKIAFMLPAMRIGGAEKIFLNFLRDIPSEYDITVILNKIEGELLDKLPANVKIYEDRLLSFKEVLKQDIKRLSLVYIIKDLSYYFRIKFLGNTEKNYRYLVSRSPYFGERFDCAVSYVANVSTQVFSLVDRVQADKKIAWIHGETSGLKDTKLFCACYEKCDKIFCVSGVTREHFVKRFVSCEDITDVYYNPINSDAVLAGAKDNCVQTKFLRDDFNIVTVGRLSPEKGCEMIPKIAKIVLQKHSNIKWYVVGGGPMLSELQNSVTELGLSEVVRLVGNQNNPYPYISECDVYVQPSYEEGYSTTICEAGILGKPIIGTTTSGGIREQIVHGVSGLIVEPTAEDIANAINRLYESPETREELSQNVLNTDMTHGGEIRKLI